MSHYEDGRKQGKTERSWKNEKKEKVSEGEHKEGEENDRNVKRDINPPSIGAVSVWGPHSQISELDLYKHVVSYRAHVVEPESLLPRTEQGAPQWISLKTGAQGTSGLTRDNIYPHTITSCLEKCIHFTVDCTLEPTLQFLHLFPPSSILYYYDSRTVQDLFNNQLCTITVYHDAFTNRSTAQSVKTVVQYSVFCGSGRSFINKRESYW